MALHLLEGKTAVITGASRGIGLAIAKLFASHGCNLVLLSRSASLDEEKQGFADFSTAKVVSVAGDITTPDTRDELKNICRREFGKIDVLVNNAGVMDLAPLMLSTDDLIRRQLEVNLVSMMQTTRDIHRNMNRGGSIINITSILGTNGAAGATAYSASKAGVIGFTKSFAKEIASKQIRVNAIAPGFITTDLTARYNSDQVSEFVSHIALGRPGETTDVANAALFLASDLSSYITGTVLAVDGGMSI